MGVTTRKKSGTKLTPAPPISKPSKAAESSRQSKAKKGAKASRSSAKSDFGGTVGATFPDSITLFTDEGVHVKTGDLFTAELPGLVLFTYPRANTGGCTAQACSLRDVFPDLKGVGYSVVGLSYDSPKSQAGWKAKHTLGYTLLCDTLDTGLIKTLGAHKAPKGIKRSVFVIRKEEGSDKAVVMLSKIGVSPKETVPVVKEYVDANPCTPRTEDKDKEMEKKDEEPEEAKEGEEDKGATKEVTKDE